MSGTRYALINSSGIVRRIVLCMQLPLAPPPGLSAVADPEAAAAVGDSWSGSSFVAAPAGQLQAEGSSAAAGSYQRSLLAAAAAMRTKGDIACSVQLLLRAKGLIP